jgi:general secretion pathway protein A
MYNHFFGLREHPFSINPDPRYLFLTPQTQRALDQLTYGILSRQGLILLTGEVGTGKTTVINRVRDWLHERQIPTAFIFNSHLDTGQLFDCILAGFGVPPTPQLSGDAYQRLNQWLCVRYRAGELPVLIVDEAQGLTMHVLEEIRMLLNSETPHGKLLQIVLAGQPELEAKLNRPELRQLKQRITFRCKTESLTVQETRGYIESRLNVAGFKGKQLFAPQAIEAVHFYSRGIPRIMNLLCEHALINAYVDGVHLVPTHMIEEIAHEFQFDDKPLPRSDFRAAGSPESITEPLAIPGGARPDSQEVAPHLAGKPDAVVTLAPISLIPAAPNTDPPGPHSEAMQSPMDSLLSPGPAAVSGASVRAFTMLDGSRGANKITEMNIASSRRLLGELAFAQPRPARASSAASPTRQQSYHVWRASHYAWARLFDKHALHRFAVDVRSRAARITQQLSDVPLRPALDWWGLVWRDAAHVLRRTAGAFVPWIRHCLAQRYDTTPRVHDPLTTIGVASASSHQLHRASQTWRERSLSVPGTLFVGMSLLQWLREPMRPSHLRPSTRR